MSETPPPPPAAPQPAAPMSPNDERMYVTLAHAGIILFGESMSLLRLGSVLLICIGLLGLKLSH